MIPAGVAAVQSRIQVLENRFSAIAPPEKARVADFERALASAQTQFAPSVSSVTGSGNGVMGSTEAPAELAQYGNGTIPPSALSSIGQGNHRMWAPAAQSFQAMEAAAARDGVSLRVTDSYRTLDAQHDLARRKGLHSHGGLAATPGTSNHGWGRSLDLDTDGGALEWLRANGNQYGFFEDVSREPWHWTFRPG